MIRSMTGYARVESQGDWGRLSWELRSVNHRYLDLQFKLPEEFRAIEPELRAVAASYVARGKVECTLRYQREVSADETIELDTNRIAQLSSAMDEVGRILGATSAPEPMRVLGYPGVVREQRSDFAPLIAEARSSFAAALTRFGSEREREGARLGEFVAERCDLLEQLVGQVRQRYPEVRDQWMLRLRQKCADLGVEVEPQRLAQELALAAQRLDVEEEMSRLESHLAEVRQALGRKEPIGRRLDFLMQELNRESNTTSSKSQDADMTRCAVEMKVIIEQMREQVQNIE